LPTNHFYPRFAFKIWNMKRSYIITGIAILFSFNSFAQNVGIGTTTPAEKLDVNGNINVTGTIKTNGVDGAANQVLMKNANGLLVWSDQCEFKNRATFVATGAQNWTVPAGVTRIRVEAWGAGGGGSNGAGGGGGGYVMALFTVTPGQIISINNGLGGAGGGTSSSYGDDTEVVVGAYTVNAAGGSGASATSYGMGSAGNVTGGSINYIVLRGEQGHHCTTSFYNNGSTYFEQSIGGDGGHGGNSINTGGRGSYRVFLGASPYTQQRQMSADQGKQPGGGGGSGWLRIADGGYSSGVTGGAGMTVISY
jgi:hypothetical protein